MVQLLGSQNDMATIRLVALHGTLRDFKASLEHIQPRTALEQLIELRQNTMKMMKDAGHLDKDVRDRTMREIQILQQYRGRLIDEDIADDAAFDAIRVWFGAEVEQRRTQAGETSSMFDNAFRFLEETFGQGQELVMFVTEITAGFDTSWFVENFGCDAYFRHNSQLFFDQTQKQIHDRIAAIRAMELE